LLGFPFLAGFYSKDSILERIYNRGTATSTLWVFLLGVGLTTAYSTKVVRLAVRTPGGVVPAVLSAGGTATPVKIPLLSLGSGAVLGGAFLARGLTPGSPLLTAGDKLCPLALIACGGGIGWSLRQLKASLLRRI